MVLEEVGDGVEKVPVGGQEGRLMILSFGENVGIQGSLAFSAPEVEDQMAQDFEHACCGLWEILVEEEFHATAS